MSYTLVEISPVQGPVVALYSYPSPEGPASWEARQVLAYGLYRNPDDKGSANFLVPLHDTDFLSEQDHDQSWGQVKKRLPTDVRADPELYALTVRTGSAWVSRDDDGVWTVDE